MKQQDNAIDTAEEQEAVVYKRREARRTRHVVRMAMSTLRDTPDWYDFAGDPQVRRIGRPLEL